MPLIAKSKKNRVLMIGSPASGKSTFVREYFSDYFRINQDTLKTKARCLKQTEEQLKTENNIIIDNTNPTQTVRQEYINLAKKYKYNIRACIMKVDKKLCEHLNWVRLRQGGELLPVNCVKYVLESFRYY